MYRETVQFIRELYKTNAFIPLHEPKFFGNEKKYVNECIDSTFVSSVGPFVTKFEESVAKYTGSKFAIATTNGTTALHLALLVAGVKSGDEVLTQALSFVATANAISYTGATPVFLDSDRERLGLSFSALKEFLETETTRDATGKTFNKKTGRLISACVPMHVFGLPVEIEKIVELCRSYKIIVVEDAAESLGSKIGLNHTGTVGLLSTLSFNGNKTITTGGGGMILTQDEGLAKKAKHLSTTGKVPHAWEFFHDQLAYNYRLPNLNAALGVAQMENLDLFLKNKRETADLYKKFFSTVAGIKFISEAEGTMSNYWLNSIMFGTIEEKDEFLKYSNQQNVMTRPVWRLLNELPMYQSSPTDHLTNAKKIAGLLVNIPSSFRGTNV